MTGIGGQTDNQALQETRDLLRELSKEIKTTIKTSSKLNKSMLALTFVVAFIAVIEFFTRVLPWFIELFKT